MVGMSKKSMKNICVHFMKDAMQSKSIRVKRNPGTFLRIWDAISFRGDQ